VAQAGLKGFNSICAVQFRRLL